MPSFYQDRLGTNIVLAKTQTRSGVFSFLADDEQLSFESPDSPPMVTKKRHHLQQTPLISQFFLAMFGPSLSW